MLIRFFSGAKLGIISKSDGFRYFPNDFLIKRLVFLYGTKVSRSHPVRTRPVRNRLPMINIKIFLSQSMFLENKGDHGVHKYFGDLVMLLIQM